MSVGPFRSTLEPFREFILSKRRARLTWEEIAQAIREQGVACTRQAVQGYYKRQKNMRVPMGFESARPTLESANRPILKQAAAEPRQIEKEKGIEWPAKKKQTKSYNDHRSKLDKKSCPSHRRTAQERQRDKPPESRACHTVKHRYSVIEHFAARSQRV